jgi:acyl carrier protein
VVASADRRPGRPTKGRFEREMAASREEIYEQVKNVLVEQLGIDEGQITEAASFQADLDADSLDLVELIMELEDQFGVKISDEDAQGIQTVGQAVDFIEKHQ